ncbi:MAG: type II toxin-antitoxin system RelE/ParE family toxin [Candidatus Lokiarchaeota archaeon]|nr:type II toxin-antitoxin system RelE/ParE family toxin [Candidatus Lokiarchaeota archaeon]
MAFYESQKSGLGVAFAEEVLATIQRILRLPLAWPTISKQCRRCLTKRFPFGIIYSIKQEYILIVAIMPLSRKPGYWEKRTGQ